jgi:hypothetical protein
MRPTTPPPGVERLVLHLTDRLADDPLTAELTAWLVASPRFRTFAEAHRDKIRKKLRGATDPEARRDVRAELAIARLLLADRKLELAFEAYGSMKGGPDFTVTAGGGRPFDLEVTRLRRFPDGAGLAGPFLAKLRQLRPGVPNALLVAIQGESAAALDVAATAQALRARADAKDEGFFAGRGFDGSRGFYDRFLRLGAVVAWCEGAQGDARAAEWVNRSARIPIAGRSLQVVLRTLRAGG